MPALEVLATVLEEVVIGQSSPSHSYDIILTLFIKHLLVVAPKVQCPGRVHLTTRGRPHRPQIIRTDKHTPLQVASLVDTLQERQGRSRPDCLVWVVGIATGTTLPALREILQNLRPMAGGLEFG